MRNLILMLSGLLLLCGLQASATESNSTTDELLEIVDVNYDYQYRPQTEYWSADIIGEMTLTVNVRGINFIWAEFSGGHYSYPEEAPLLGSWLQSFDPEIGTITVHFPIILWGGWVRCGYYPKNSTEMVYSPYIWSTDYIDPETLELYFGAVETITADPAISIEIHDKEVALSGLANDNVQVTVIDISGRTVYNQMLTTASGTAQVQLDHLNSGVYVLSANDGNNTLTTKISLK